jgi:hypothetical protein
MIRMMKRIRTDELMKVMLLAERRELLKSKREQAAQSARREKEENNDEEEYRGFIVHHGKTGRRRRFSCALSSTGHKITKSNLRFTIYRRRFAVRNLEGKSNVREDTNCASNSA